MTCALTQKDIYNAIGENWDEVHRVDNKGVKVSEELSLFSTT